MDFFYGVSSVPIAVKDNLPSYKLAPVTTEKGQEWGINVSNDGKYVAYSHRKLTDENGRIKIKNTETGEEKYLTKLEHNGQGAVWHPTLPTLYYTQHIDEECTIWRASNVWLSAQFKQIASCGEPFNASPLNIDNKAEWLYYIAYTQDNISGYS